MKVFIAGIMRGSNDDESFHEQGYRGAVKRLVRQYLKGAEIYDPLQSCDIEQSNKNDDKRNEQIYITEAQVAKEADLLIAFLPEASMGTAIEMWEAYNNGAIIISITKMVHNWTVKFLSTKVYTDFFLFEKALKSGAIQQCFDSI